MIDAHHHIWTIGANGCTWPSPDLERIYRDFDLQELQAHARPLGIAGSVLVQSQANDADTDAMLDLAESAPFVLGVVGWVDLAAHGAPARIASLARRPKLKGLRPMLQALSDDGWILRAELEPALEAMSARDLAFDALVLPRHLSPLLTFARRWPDLHVVIDHGGKPDIAGGGLDPWRSQINDLARLPNVFCKLSGLMTEAGTDPSPDRLAPYVEHLVEAFGPERLMWGSDWPVLNLAGDYAQWHATARALCTLTLPGDLAELFGETARRFYRL